MGRERSWPAVSGLDSISEPRQIAETTVVRIGLRKATSVAPLHSECRLLAVRPEGANHQ